MMRMMMTKGREGNEKRERKEDLCTRLPISRKEK